MDDDSGLTGNVIGAAIAVHRELGPGLDEAAYEQALSVRLATLGVSHVCQQELPLTYKGVALDCGFRLDLLVDGRLPIELKTAEAILPIHDAQLLTYMRLGGFRLGLLINFEVAVLKEGVRRRALSEPRASVASSPAEMHGRCDPLSTELVDAAFEVHRTFGAGLMRSAYEECLCHELSLRQIDFERKHRIPLRFEGIEIDRGVEIPLFVAGRIPILCLSVATLTKLHEARLLARLRQTRSPFGFLMNFNSAVFAQGIRRLTLK